jgi:hypothetical protein
MAEWNFGEDENRRKAKDRCEVWVAKRLDFKVFLVSINGRNPTADFVNRLWDIPRVVKSASAASSDSTGWIFDKKTRLPAIIFAADNIRWRQDDWVEVDGGYHCGGLCGAGFTFQLRLERGGWAVKESFQKWIS